LPPQGRAEIARWLNAKETDVLAYDSSPIILPE
jgi:hypothetical protein